MRDTVDLAREAGFAVEVSTDPNSPPSWRGAGHCDRFKAFEALVRAEERKRQWTDIDIDKLSILAGIDPTHKVELGLVRSVVRTILRGETK